jgi:hypothetical protein
LLNKGHETGGRRGTVKFFAVHVNRWGANRVPDVVINDLVIPYTVLLREAEKHVLH